MPLWLRGNPKSSIGFRLEGFMHIYGIYLLRPESTYTGTLEGLSMYHMGT